MRAIQVCISPDDVLIVRNIYRDSMIYHNKYPRLKCYQQFFITHYHLLPLNSLNMLRQRNYMNASNKGRILAFLLYKARSVCLMHQKL